MGFDNECILNIQSLAGEYFCPVCRLLVYPNEALQSQCTHLYCKPCLKYIASTTQACPYDGFLVTEADSKPLVESNKTLAETIGKITVHCLFHRSGCTWQGALSDCTSHCSGCAFGNSPVVCNRCGIQIVHRQVQEHAQNCPGVQPQASQTDGVPDATNTGAAATGDETQAVTHAGATTSQGQTQTTATPPPGKDPNQQPSSNSQSQTVAQAAVPAADQWYQQYYQQYPGYNPYQQYYPYQQQAVPPYQQQLLQVQPQSYMQPQPLPQPQPQMPPQPQVQPPAQSQPQLQPSHPPVQASVATQPHHAQVNSQQQSQPLHHGQPLPQPQAYPYAPAQSYPQAPSLSYPQSHPHPQPQPIMPLPQHMQILQYPQPQTQMQHTQLLIQQPVPQPQLQSQSHPRAQLQTQVQHHPQPPSQLQPHPSLLNQPQAQHTSANAVTGHHSNPQSQPHQQMPPSGPPQHSMYVHPHAAPQSQLQNQFPQQPPSARPLQSHAAISNQQQSTFLPSPGQVAIIPAAQQLPVRPLAHQPGGPVSQHPVVHPVQQPMSHQYVQQQQPFAGQHQQGPFSQPQLPVQSQLRPLGPPHSFQQSPLAYLQPQQNALMHGMQPHQPPNLGQPTTPNHGLQSQPYQQSATGLPGRPVQFGAIQPPSNRSNLPWTNNDVQLSSEQQSGITSKPTLSDKLDIAEKSVDKREAESYEKTATTDNLDPKMVVQADAVGMKVPKSETDVRSVVDEIKTVVKGKNNAIDTSAKEFMMKPDSCAAENAEPINKMAKEEVIENIENQRDSANVDRKLEEHSVYKEGLQLEAQSEKLQKEKNLPQAQAASEGPGAVPLTVQVQAGRFMQSPPSLGGSSTFQQSPAAPSMFQTPVLGAVNQTQAPGHPSSQFRSPMYKPHGPEIPHPISGTAASLGRGPGQPGPHQHSFELPSVAPHGPYSQGNVPPHVGANRISHGDSIEGLRSLQPTAFPPHGRMMAGGPAYGPEDQMGEKQPSNPMEAEMFTSQRPVYMDGRRSESHFPGSLEWGPYGQPSMMRMNGVPGPELRDERFKSFPGEHLNPFPKDTARRVIGRGEFEEDLKQFSRPSHLDAKPVPKFGSHYPSSTPFDMGPHGFGMDMGPRPFERGLNYDPGLKMDPMGGSATSRFLTSYHDDASGRSDSSHAHPDFAGPGATYGQRQMDGLSPRSPFRDYPGISSRGFGGLPGSRLGRDDIDGREFRQFGDPISNSFHDSRFPVLPSHLHRGEFEGPGQDFLPGHLRRDEHLGSHDLRLGKTGGFGGFPGHARIGDLGGPGNFPHPRLGEPGFRSSFSRRGFPNNGDMEPFDNSRKRLPSMGWCRICKVDCATVDGLDLHSQTREHQKMAMDMVISIKQNAKKQKLSSIDCGSTDDAIKSRNVNFEGRGKNR